MTAEPTLRGGKQGLLLFFVPVDHPHRDAVCATLAWIARDEGLLFECYYEGRASGVHFGGGLPWQYALEDLRGGTFEGGHHREQLGLLLRRFDCQAACLGPTVFEQALTGAGVPFRARSGDVARFYAEFFASAGLEAPQRVLVVGPGRGRLSLVPYACHEVAQRKVLAIAGGDDQALAGFGEGVQIERLWQDDTAATAVEDRSLEMARKWSSVTTTFLFADPEAAGRWIPSAIRRGWAPVYGVPQARTIRRLAERLASVPAVWGRQQDDSDFLELSRQGVAFQLIDPGRPPFPVIDEASAPRSTSPACGSEPGDGQLRQWAEEGVIVTSLVFWTGMVRELECLYALADAISGTGLRAGLALTTESLRYFESSPLAMLAVPPERGGLGGQVEVLVASAGVGGLLESEGPLEKFAATLQESVQPLREAGQMPSGWWAVMDAPLLPRRVSRLAVRAWPPAVTLRYRRRPLEVAAEDEGGAGAGARASLRARVRDSPLGRFFEPERPFDAFQPGGPRRDLLEAVRASGFEYALTKSGFGAPPTVATGIDGLTVINYTAGRWDGWTPFETVNALSDLTQAEHGLRQAGRPGWLLGGIDSCLWAFSGHVLDRGRELREICRWTAEGGSSGRLRNVTPHTMARYARILGEMGLVRAAPAN